MRHICVVLALFVAAANSGCSASSGRAGLAPGNPGSQLDDNGRFKVSVVTNGREVKDLNQDLVHRVAISRAQVDSILESWPAQFRKIGQTRDEYDSQGKYMGLRIAGPSTGAPVPVLGLRDRDVITAVGPKPVRAEGDMLALFKDLKQSGRATMTIERSGMPHKFLYFSPAK